MTILATAIVSAFTGIAIAELEERGIIPSCTGTFIILAGAALMTAAVML